MVLLRMRESKPDNIQGQHVHAFAKCTREITAYKLYSSNIHMYVASENTECTKWLVSAGPVDVTKVRRVE